MIITRRRNDCAVVVDMGGGWGGSPRDKLTHDHDINVFEFVPSGESTASDKHKNFGFINLRAEAWWKFREAIDPDSGEDIELPNDPRLIAQLIAPRYQFSGKNIRRSNNKIASPGFTVNGRPPLHGIDAINYCGRRRQQIRKA